MERTHKKHSPLTKHGHSGTVAPGGLTSQSHDGPLRGTSRATSKGGMKTTTINLSDQSSLHLMYLDQEVLAEGLKHSTQLMQQHREEGNSRRQRHEQRRRKFLRQLDTTQMNYSSKFFDQEVVGQLLNFSRCEQEEKEFKDEVLSYKDIMVINRENRQNKIEELKDQEKSRDAAWESVEAKREVDWVIHSDTNSQLQRRDVLLTATKSAERDEAITMVQDFLAKMLDQVDWTVTCREIGGFGSKVEVDNSLSKQDDPLPSLLWKDASTMLTSNLPFFEQLPNLKPMLPSSLLLPFSISETPLLADYDWLMEGTFKGTNVLDRKKLLSSGISSSSFLAKDDWTNFLKSLNEGSVNKFQEASGGIDTNNPPQVEEKDEKTYEKDEVLTPVWLHNVPPPYLLGEAVVEVRTRVNPVPEEPPAAFDTKHMPFRTVLFGVSNRMKDMIVTEVKRQIPRIFILSVEELVQKVFDYRSNPSYDSESEYGKLAQNVFDSLASGTGITDKIYVSLIIHELKTNIPLKNNGFLIRDYPSSTEQLLLLLEGFSQIRYDQHRPQRADCASLLAPLPPYTEDLVFDIKKCGLDLVLCVDEPANNDQNVTPIDLPLRERVRARKNLFTQEVVYLNDDTESVVGLQSVYDPKRPMITAGIDLTIAEQNTQELVKLCSKLKLLDNIEFQNYQSAEEAIFSKVSQLREKLIPFEQQSEDFWINYDLEEEAKKKQKEEEELAAAIALQQAELEAMQKKQDDEAINAKEVEAKIEEVQDSDHPSAIDAPVANTEHVTTENGADAVEGEVASPEPPKPVFEKAPVVVQDNQLPIALAKALYAIWQKNESFSADNGLNYFSSMRDIRYQFVQRRRMALDTIYIAMIRIDNRQEIFNEFREQFNTIDDEMRYDPDCISELHLRTMDLRNQWSKITEQRLKDMKDTIQNITLDGSVSVLSYNCRYESAYFLQSELNRFYHNLQIIFDYTKSIQGFKCCEKVRNDMEVLLPITVYDEVEADPKGGKDKGKDKEKDKKGKDKGGSSFTPYREPLAPYFMTNTQSIISQIPVGKKFVEEVVDPKAKGKPKESKKGEDGAAVDYFLEMESKIKEEIGKWKEGAFTVPRDLYYNKEEALCKSIERAIWFEAEKLSLSCEMVAMRLNEQISWLEQSEKELITLLTYIADDRFMRELAAGEDLILVIERCIMNAQPLQQLWIVTPDAKPLIDPYTAWERMKQYLTADVLENLAALQEEERQRKLLWEQQRREQEEREAREANERLVNEMLEAQRHVLESVDDIVLNSRGGSRPTTSHGGEYGAASSSAGIAAGGYGSYGGAVPYGSASDGYGSGVANYGSASNGYNGVIGSNVTATGVKHGTGKPLVIGERVGRNPIRGRRDDAGKLRTTLQQGTSINATGSSSTTASFSANGTAGQNSSNKQRQQSPGLYVATTTGSGEPVTSSVRERELYLQQKQQLEEKFQKLRAEREEEFRSMGMSHSAALLAAHHDLLLEEQHQLEDLEAKFKPRRSNSAASNSGRRASIRK